MTLKSFQNVGNDLFIAGLNNSNSGNLSVRKNDKMVITKTGSMLHHLTCDDLIETSLIVKDENASKASREYPVHKAIYAATAANAVVHAHCPHLVALSFLSDVFAPIDAEGKYYFPESVPVIAVKNAIASEEVGEKAAAVIGKSTAIVVRGHGVFAIGADLYEAYKRVSSLEHSAKIFYLYNNLKSL
ncbi:MAG: aldolase [Candidatus Riflebacteria bacterium]|nr:aldolase [Candidatus Riflebacteria bacterium]